MSCKSSFNFILCCLHQWHDAHPPVRYHCARHSMLTASTPSSGWCIAIHVLTRTRSDGPAPKTSWIAAVIITSVSRVPPASLDSNHQLKECEEHGSWNPSSRSRSSDPAGSVDDESRLWFETTSPIKRPLAWHQNWT